jgi:cytochrome bd ubiquinol oxidase subunit I
MSLTCRRPAHSHLHATAFSIFFSDKVSAVFVTLVNGWMNTPTGFDIVAGKFKNIHPYVAMLNSAGMTT